MVLFELRLQLTIKKGISNIQQGISNVQVGWRLGGCSVRDERIQFGREKKT
jgi:hypothetical protein